MNRREFLARAGLVATWAAISVRVSGCGKSDSNPMDGGNGDIAGSVSPAQGHTHSVSISAAEVTAGNAVTLTLSTTGGHDHHVSLTAEQVMDIGAGTQVALDSTNDSGHVHVVTFN